MGEQSQIRIGDWTVDPASNQLFGEDGALHIEPRAMEVLMYLAGHPGEVVSMDTLIAEVWGGRVVGDGSVYLVMNQLRNALGDGRNGAGYILTVPKRGYQLLAPVVPADAPAQGRPLSGPRLRYLLTAALAATFGAAAYWILSGDSEADWLRDEALPEIEEILSSGDWHAAFRLAEEAEARVPGSTELAEVWPRISWEVTLRSEPPGALAFRRPFGGSDDDWQVLGPTPVNNIRIPFGLSELRFEREGYSAMNRLIGGGLLVGRRLPSSNLHLVSNEVFQLDGSSTLPTGMVRVPGWSLDLQGEVIDVADFFLDRYEVTNANYKAFVDAGGYEQSQYWDPIFVGGKEIRWADAMALFKDQTGRTGPSTWEAGDYPEGEDDMPVAGVSWYEASAFARFSGKTLPTAHHWQRALTVAALPWVLPLSNFSGDGPREVTESRAMSFAGSYDMAGNVREWTANAIGDERIVRGGSWADAYYTAAAEQTSAPPIDRSPGNGFRLATIDETAAVMSRLLEAVPARTSASDALSRQPVSDDLFEAYGRVFDYDDTPLNARVESTTETRLWTREQVLFDPGYGDDDVVLYLYLPKNAAPPLQVVVYWPGWDAFLIDDITAYSKHVDFLVKSGRAVAFPVYPGSFERGDRTSRPAFGSTAYRDNTVSSVKDLRRTIDYLETRPDIDSSSIAYFGYSWGGVNGPVAIAHEPRIQLAVIYVALLPPVEATPEIDPVHALPRVQVPTLLLSGEFDALVPVENAQRYFELIGVPEDDKKHVITPGGHYVPRNVLVRETLDWFDKYQDIPETRRPAN